MCLPMAAGSAAERRDADALAAALKRAPKTRRGRKILKQREPQIIEDAKTALIVRGGKCGTDVCSFLRDLHGIRPAHSTLYMRKHEEHPFQDVTRLEALCAKQDSSLFAFGSSSKKRPFRVIFGRLFDGHVLDMQEFDVQDFKPCSKFTSVRRDVVSGSKPLVVFQGAGFEADDRMKRTKSLLLDFFSGPTPDKVLLQGLDQVVICSSVDAQAAKTPNDKRPAAQVLVRRFRVKFGKSGSKLPRVELDEVGPRFSLGLDRTREPDRERWKQALKVPKAAKPAKVKNMSKDSVGKKRGRIHLGKQDFDQIHTVHHGLSKKRKLKADLAGAALVAAAES